MRTRSGGITLLVVAAVLLGNSDTLAAQGGNPAHTHMGHVADGFSGTPDGQGLLPTAKAEAEILARHAGLMARDPSNLEAVKLHSGHVLHAADPGEVESGPGLGFGLKPAAAGVARHIELASGSDGASDNIKTHAIHIATSANNTVSRADEIIMLARLLQEASEAGPDVSQLVERLETTAEQLQGGYDANGDGRTGWQQGEGGLDQAETHMGLMELGEEGG